MGLLPKIFWDIFYLKYLISVQLYIWVAATIANSHWKFGKHTSSCIKYYNPKLGLNYNWSKDLSKGKEDN